MKRHYIFYLCVLPLLLSTFSFGQYHWTRRVYHDDVVIPNYVNPQYAVCHKGLENILRLYIPVDSTVITKDIDINSLELKRVDTIIVGQDFGSYSDFVMSKNKDVLVSFQKIAIYNRTNRSCKVYEVPGDYRYAKRLNDSSILLYDIYIYHPGDAFAGLNMMIFNEHDGKISKSAEYRFPGIELSYMSTSWLTCSAHNIYVTTPLSGLLTTYDLDLKPIDSTYLPVNWIEPKKNLEFEKESTTLAYSEWYRIHALYQQYGKDSIHRNRSLINDTLFAKERIARVLNKAHDELQFIEHIIPYTDSVFILVVSRPKPKPFLYRDLIFYNYKRKQVEKYILDWAIGSMDSLTKFEDFFYVDAASSVRITPYFHEGKVFAPTNYNPSLYRNGSKDSLKKSIFKDIKSNNYRWDLLEYQY